MSSGPLNLSNQQLESASFNSPWEASLFALAVQLSRQGVFTWADWTKAIGEEIRNESADNGEEYYHRWCDALQNILTNDEIFSIEGSITHEKLKEAVVKSGINQLKFQIDLEKDEVDKIIALSSFIAGGSGARGTPSMFVNEFFYPGYLSKDRIEGLLNQ